MEGFITVVIIIFIGFVWIMISSFKDHKKHEEARVERFLKDDIKMEISLSHISGYPYANVINLFQIKNDNTVWITTYLHPDLDNGGYYGKGESHQIPVENILRIENKTEEELRKDITIPRVLLGGILALAVPKKTEIKKQYLYLSYVDSGVQVDCLFEGYPHVNLGKLTSEVNRLRIEKNKIKELGTN